MRIQHYDGKEKINQRSVPRSKAGRPVKRRLSLQVIDYCRCWYHFGDFAAGVVADGVEHVK